MSFKSQNMQSEKCLSLGLFVLASGWERGWKKSAKLVCFPYSPGALQALKAAADFSLLLCRQSPDVVREQFTQTLIFPRVIVP